MIYGGVSALMAETISLVVDVSALMGDLHGTSLIKFYYN